jgi:hypothetical protein
MTHVELRQLAHELGDSVLAIRAALSVIPPEKHAEWIALMKSDSKAGMDVARTHGWTLRLALQQRP